MNIFKLPGNIAGTIVQENVDVLFGVNRDVSYPSNSLSVRYNSINEKLSLCFIFAARSLQSCRF